MNDREYPIYLRFGGLPPGGRSPTLRGKLALGMIPEEGLCFPDPNEPLFERGVSCFRARRISGGGYEVDVSGSPSLALTFRTLSRSGRPVYLLSGREVCIGTDREPILVDAVATPLPPDTRVRSCRCHEEKAVLFEERMGVFGPLLAALTPHATDTALNSKLHGPEHWLHVFLYGARLAKQTPGADPRVVGLFAVLHDSRRVSDGHDSNHGHCAAKLAEGLRGKLFEATDGQTCLLKRALRLHADGLVEEDPTIGCCWDADRLDLPRCGIKPDPEYFSTVAAKEILASPDPRGSR